MEKLRVLVANEPRSYREALSWYLREMRPDLEVLLLEPEALEREVARSAPGLVVCSSLTPAVQERALGWVELYPEGEALMYVSVKGSVSRTMAGLDAGLPNLLWVVDRTAEVLARGADRV